MSPISFVLFIFNLMCQAFLSQFCVLNPRVLLLLYAHRALVQPRTWWSLLCLHPCQASATIISISTWSPPPIYHLFIYLFIYLSRRVVQPVRLLQATVENIMKEKMPRKGSRWWFSWRGRNSSIKSVGSKAMFLTPTPESSTRKSGFKMFCWLCTKSLFEGLLVHPDPTHRTANSMQINNYLTLNVNAVK